MNPFDLGSNTCAKPTGDMQLASIHFNYLTYKIRK